MTDYVLSGLTKRRAELSGEADALRSRLAQIATDIGHLDAVIRQFDPDHDIPGIKPKRARQQDAAGRGEMSRFVLGVLRETAELVTTQEVVERLIAARGQDGKDRRLVKQLTKRIGMALARQEKQGAVHSMRTAGQAVTWRTVG